MRHLWSLLAGVVAAPLTWLFLATGQHRSQRVVERWDEAARFDTVDLIGPVIYLAVAGILLGVLGTLRWSPAGPTAAGLLFLIPTVLMFMNPFTTLEGFFRPDDGAHRRLLGQDLEPWLPVANGTLLVLGALLLMAVFSAQRWRHWPVQPAPLPPATDEEVVSGISAISAQGRSPESPSTTSGTGPPSGADSDGLPDPDRGEPAEKRAPMTDDEILAAAAAYEAEAAAAGPTAGKPAAEKPAAGKPAAGGAAGSEPAPERPGPANPTPEKPAPAAPAPEQSPPTAPAPEQSPPEAPAPERSTRAKPAAAKRTPAKRTPAKPQPEETGPDPSPGPDPDPDPDPGPGPGEERKN